MQQSQEPITQIQPMSMEESKAFCAQCWDAFHLAFQAELGIRFFASVLQAHEENLRTAVMRSERDKEAYNLLTVLVDAGLDRDESRRFLRIPKI